MAWVPDFLTLMGHLGNTTSIISWHFSRALLKKQGLEVLRLLMKCLLEYRSKLYFCASYSHYAFQVVDFSEAEWKDAGFGSLH
jgi:hypothetical protein